MRYVAFLRGVSPTNASMPELKRCFESAGFTNVKTVLASGNVVFDSSSRSTAELERKAEAAMAKQLKRTFYTIIRSVDTLTELIDADPFSAFQLPENAKRVVTFLRSAPKKSPTLPAPVDGAHMLAVAGCEVFTAYTPHPRGPVFMVLIKKTLGMDVTTRTWDTVKKCARA